MWALAAGCRRVQRVLPRAASRQNSVRLLPSSAEVSKKSLPLQTTGDELPTPGISTFHRRLSLSDQVSGTSLSLLTPVPLGPRKRGQSEGRAGAPARRAAARAS